MSCRAAGLLMVIALTLLSLGDMIRARAIRWVPGGLGFGAQPL